MINSIKFFLYSIEFSSLKKKIKNSIKLVISDVWSLEISFHFTPITPTPLFEFWHWFILLLQSMSQQDPQLDNHYTYDQGPNNPPTTKIFGPLHSASELFPLSPIEVRNAFSFPKLLFETNMSTFWSSSDHVQTSALTFYVAICFRIWHWLPCCWDHCVCLVMKTCQSS